MHSPNTFDYKIYTFNLSIKFIAPNLEFTTTRKVSIITI